MFHAQLACESCHFATVRFVTSYYPPGDSVDIIFQNMMDNSFRILSYRGVVQRLGDAKPTEQRLDAAIERIGFEAMHSDEEQVNVWVSPDAFAKRKCPMCNQQTVALRLCGIL